MADASLSGTPLTKCTRKAARAKGTPPNTAARMTRRPSLGQGSGQRTGGSPRSRARRSTSAMPASRSGPSAHDIRPVLRKIPPSRTGTHSTSSSPNRSSTRSAASHAYGDPRS